MALMDAGMPRLGGHEAAREIRREYPEVRIVLMSAAFGVAGAMDPAAMGVDGLLPKPMEPAVLVETVRRTLTLPRPN